MAHDRPGLSAGSAIIDSVAYMVPGNNASNILAGAGQALLWVVRPANLIDMLSQRLSARLGIAIRHDPAELCRDHFSRPIVWIMWVVSKKAAMASVLADISEVRLVCHSYSAWH